MKPPDHAAGPAPVAHRTVITLIILTTGIGPFTLNVPLPSMPGIAVALDASYGRVQLVLTLFLLALALGQFVYGPLSDRFGRRPVMIAGLAVFLLGSLICAAAPTVEILLAGRFVQGFGGCAGMVLGRAMLRDLYGRDRAASLLGYVTMAMVAAPMIAPALGGFLDELFDWRAGFVMVTAVGATLLAVTAMHLPETHHERMASAGILGLLRGSKRLLTMPAFLAHGTVMAFTSGMFFSFLAGAPYIVVTLMGRSPAEYGLWFAANAACYMLANFLSGRYAGRVGVGPLMRYGSSLNMIGIALLIAAAWLAPFTPASIFVPMMVIALGNGLVLPSVIAAAVSARPDLAGAASGLSGGLQMGLAAAVTVLVAVNLDETATPMIAVMTGCGVIAALGYLASRRYL
jgi:MFS transporter, DHA1 family, multidrug resistance protein